MTNFETIQTTLKELLHNIGDYLKKNISDENNRKGLKELEDVLIETSSEVGRIKKSYSKIELYTEKDNISMKRHLLSINNVLKKISSLSRNFKIARMSQKYYDRIFKESDILKQMLVDLKEFNKKNLLDRLENIVNNEIKIFEDKINTANNLIKNKVNDIEFIHKSISKNFTDDSSKLHVSKENNFSILKPRTYSIFGILFTFSMIWIICGVVFFYSINYDLIKKVSDFIFFESFINYGNFEKVLMLKDLFKIIFIYKLPFFIFCVSPAFIILNEAYKQKNKHLQLYLLEDSLIRINSRIDSIKDDEIRDITIKYVVKVLASNLSSNNKKDILSSKDLKRILKFLEQIKAFDNCCGFSPKSDSKSED